MRRARPVFELLLGGAALVAVAQVAGSSVTTPEPPSRTIQISGARIDGARRAFLASTGRDPDDTEVAALVDAEVVDEILFREALARGLDREDAVVQRRLTGNLAFVDGCDDPTGAPRTHDEHELSLDMLARDVVVHRRLSARMRALLEEAALRDEPDDATLEAALARHAERFALPARVTVTQVLLRDDGAPESVVTRADAALATLRLGGTLDVAAASASAPNLPPLQSERDLTRQLGPAFAAAALAATPGEWTGPVRSPLGLHLLRVEQHEPAQAPTLATVRNQVRELVRRERADAALREALASLRARYVVVDTRPSEASS